MDNCADAVDRLLFTIQTGIDNSHSILQVLSVSGPNSENWEYLNYTASVIPSFRPSVKAHEDIITLSRRSRHRS